MASIRENLRKGTNEVQSWSVLYRHGRRQTSLTFESAKAAEQFKVLVNTLGVDRALKAIESDQDNRYTVGELADAFLKWKARDVTERTMIDYRRDVKNWIEPWFGHRAAEHVDETDVQKWVDHMAQSLEPKSVADRHMLLHAMFQFGKAKSRRLVTHNPCLETELPKKVKKPPKGLTVPEFRAITAAARGPKNNADAADLITFLGETGWRFSEATALDVAYVDDDGTDVWVTVGQVFRIDENHRQVIAVDAAKSYAAFRRIRMFPESAAVIRRRLAGKRPGDLVFTNSRGNPWNQNTFLRVTWPGILTAAGLWKGARKSPTPHWLRHTHVAVLAAAGVPMQEIQRRIGHESITTTIGVYGGMIGDISDDSMSNAAAIMSGTKNAPSIAPGEVVLGALVDAGPLELA